MTTVQVQDGATVPEMADTGGRVRAVSSSALVSTDDGADCSSGAPQTICGAATLRGSLGAPLRGAGRPGGTSLKLWYSIGERVRRL